LSALSTGFRNLRARLSRAKLIEGGIAFLEITRNERTGHWHPHSHVIFAGKYIAKAVLRDMWFDITGDSWIVDIRLIRTPQAAASYVLKYATKAISARVWRNPDALTEAIRALSGKRAFNCFGSWTAFNLSRVPPTDLVWEFFETLPNLIRRYKAGDAAAGQVLSRLTNRCLNDSTPSDIYDFP